jgi:hypothetical protein
MKKIVLFSAGMLALTLLSGRVHADTTLLYGTYTDWTCWNGTPGASSYTVQAVSNFNYGNLTVNGVGDTNLDSNSSSVIGETSMTGALESVPYHLLVGGAPQVT